MILNKPPNERLVEVEYSGNTIKVRAIYGRDGVLPHWESEDGTKSWSPDFFTSWQYITKEI